MVDDSAERSTALDSAAAAPARAAVRLDDGTVVFLDRLALFGRDPRPAAGEDGALTVALRDSRHELADTHVSIAPARGGFYVGDRFSPDGVEVVAPGGAVEALRPGELRLVPAGWQVLLGLRTIELVGPA